MLNDRPRPKEKQKKQHSVRREYAHFRLRKGDTFGTADFILSSPYPELIMLNARPFRKGSMSLAKKPPICLKPYK